MQDILLYHFFSLYCLMRYIFYHSPMVYTTIVSCCYILVVPYVLEPMITCIYCMHGGCYPYLVIVGDQSFTLMECVYTLSLPYSAVHGTQLGVSYCSIVMKCTTYSVISLQMGLLYGGIAIIVNFYWNSRNQLFPLFESVRITQNCRR